MKIYDKADWHIDADENKEEVIEKFKILFATLRAKEMLTQEGNEVIDIGIDASVSLHQRLLTKEGNEFINEHYDSLINLKSSELEVKLRSL